ncbi:MAG: ROK family protein [bacterium]
MKGSYLIGIDLGGTKMLCAVLDRNYEVLARTKVKVGADRDNETILKSMIEAVESALNDANIDRDALESIGIVSPGPIDFADGVVLETPNLDLSNFPVRDALEKEFACPVLLENDVNAGTYGEYIRGAAAGFRHVVGIFPGTGVGGGLILDGRLFRGSTGGAGEIGHITIEPDGPKCGCGNYGCLEQMASRTAIAKELVGLVISGQSKTILESAGTDIARVRSKTILKAVEAGEQPVIEVVQRAARYMGMGMAAAVNIFDPELIVLGGGLIEKLGHFYVEEAERSMRRHAMQGLVSHVEVRQAQLGDDAAVVGVAALAHEHAETSARAATPAGTAKEDA